MSGLLDELFPGLFPSSETPLVRPTPSEEDDNAPAPTASGDGNRLLRPTGPGAPSAAPAPTDTTGDEDADDGPSPSQPSNDEGEEDQNQPGNRPGGPQTTFVITTRPSQASTSTPTPLTSLSSSASPTEIVNPGASSIPPLDPEDEDATLIQAPTPTTPLQIPGSTLLPPPNLSAPSSSSSTSSSSPNSAESAVSSSGGGDGGSDGLPSQLMPALPIALGIVGGVLLVGIVLGTLYRKSKWPFAGRSPSGRRNFEELDDDHGELERQQKMKFEPRVSRYFRGKATNF